jgi:hypothetical protein
VSVTRSGRPYDQSLEPVHVRVEAYACMGQWTVSAVVRYQDSEHESVSVHQVTVSGVPLGQGDPSDVLWRVAQAVVDATYEDVS